MNWNERFHAHLDECRQCREQPFNLCWQGQILIQAAGQETACRIADEVK